MRAQQGRHFLKGEKVGWIRNREDLRDLRTLPEYKYILRIIDRLPTLDESHVYDETYRGNRDYLLHYSKMVYYEMWLNIAGHLIIRDKILELGCGPGHLAHLLYDRGFRNYTGIDFSPVAIAMAKEKVPEFRLMVTDLTDPGFDFYAYHDHIFICTEVLEHLKDDLELLRRLPPVEIIFSIPDFMVPNHYRCFASEDEVTERYGRYISIDYIKSFSAGKNKWFLAQGFIKPC